MRTQSAVSAMKIISLFFYLLAGATAQPVSGLTAGVARADITPTVSMPMYGYENRKCGPSNGVHDPLYAKALVFEDGGGRVAIVTLDLGSIVSEHLKDEVATKLNIPVLLLAASHSHSSPSFLPSGSAPVRSEAGAAYQAELERKIFDAVKEALKSMFPAKVSVSPTFALGGHFRLSGQKIPFPFNIGTPKIAKNRLGEDLASFLRDRSLACCC
jgi:hypothetical protein